MFVATGQETRQDTAGTTVPTDSWRLFVSTLADKRQSLGAISVTRSAVQIVIGKACHTKCFRLCRNVIPLVFPSCYIQCRSHVNWKESFLLQLSWTYDTIITNIECLNLQPIRFLQEWQPVCRSAVNTTTAAALPCWTSQLPCSCQTAKLQEDCRMTVILWGWELCWH